MIDDPVGEQWQQEANSHFEKVGAEGWIDNPHPLPDFNEKRPEHVTRELLGRFLYDRDAQVLHDAHAAKSECQLDSIQNGTFYHFAHEVPDEHDTRCPLCLE